MTWQFRSRVDHPLIRNCLTFATKVLRTATFASTNQWPLASTRTYYAYGTIESTPVRRGKTSRRAETDSEKEV